MQEGGSAGYRPAETFPRFSVSLVEADRRVSGPENLFFFKEYGQEPDSRQYLVTEHPAKRQNITVFPNPDVRRTAFDTLTAVGAGFRVKIER